MPSLAQLEEFKSSFKDVGNEASIMSKTPALIEDFELPEDDPPSPFPEDLAGGPLPDIEPKLRVSDLGLDLPPESFGGGDDSGGGFDFGDLLGGDLDGLSPGGDSETPTAKSFAESDFTGDDFTGTDIPAMDAPDMSDMPDMPGMDLPEDLLSGFSDDLESGGLPRDEELGDVAGSAAEPPADFGQDGVEPAAEAETASAVDAGAAADSGDFAGMEFPDIDLSEAVDMGGESASSPVVPAGEESDAGSGLGDDGPPALDDGFPDMGGEITNASVVTDESVVDEGAVVDENAAPEESEAAFTPDETAAEEEIALPGEESGAFDLGDLPDFGDADTSLEGDGLPALDDSFPGIDDDFGLPPDADFAAGVSGAGDGAAFDAGAAADMDGTAAGSGLEGLDLGDFGAENPAAGDFDSAGFGADGSIDFGTDDVGAGFGDDTGGGTPDADFAEDAGSAEAADDFPNLSEMSATEGSETEGADPFDDFTSGADWNIPDTPPETADYTDAAAKDDLVDFDLAGFGDAGEQKQSGAAGEAGGFSDEVEEIQLGEDEFRLLQDTLSNYPLNLRVACEELIVEEAVAPDQMSALIKLLVRGAPAKETAALAGKILGRAIPIPRGYAKQTGAELEAEQASLGYIFTKRFLPVLRLAGAILVVVASLGYLIWRFAVIPLQAESLYKDGYELIPSGEYAQANERFREAFEKHRVKKWFYRYAEAFRDERQYIYAEQKYDELLRVYPRDKKGALDYAAMETNVIRNYEKADRLIRTNILDYAVNDREGLLALAETNLAWGETDASRYEEARGAYARLMEQYGRRDPYLEGMLKYFIRTDNLGEVIPLQDYFMSDPKKRVISVPTLAELGGYLVDKHFEETEGVPGEFVDQIDGIRDVLVRAIQADGSYPESYYHLARYNSRYGLDGEERRNLEDAIRAFSEAREETPKRAAYHIDARRRYGEVLIAAREFFPAGEELIRGVRLYEDARARGVIKEPRPEFGRLYADLGDLEFFVRSGDMNEAIRFYEEAERNDWSPPEIQYRMGAAHYQNGNFEEALRRFFVLSSVMPNNRRLLYALGNAAYLRGNYFAAQGYYNRLMDLLDSERVRFPDITPGGRPEGQELAERIMVADNNLGVTLEALTRVSGDTSYRTRALYLFSESIRAWDVLTRDPENLTRMQPIEDLYSPGINLAFLNAQNILHASPSYEQQIFMRIDKDCLEPSDWEARVPRDYRLSDQLPITVD